MYSTGESNKIHFLLVSDLSVLAPVSFFKNVITTNIPSRALYFSLAPLSYDDEYVLFWKAVVVVRCSC